MGKSKYRTLIKNFIYFFISSVATKLIGYILLPIYTASMTTEQYGIADIMMSTNNLIYPIILLGMAGAVVRFCMEQEKDRKVVFTSALMILLVSSVISIVSVPIIRMIPTYREYAIILPIMAFTLNCMELMNSLCRAIDKAKVIVQGNLIYGVTLLVSTVIALKFMRLGVQGYLWSYTLANIATCIYIAYTIRIKEYISFKYQWKTYKLQIKQLLQYGVPLVPNSLAWWVTQLSDRYMVAYWHGNAVNGLYSVAYKIPSIIKTVVNVFTQAWQLSAFQEHKSEDAVSFYNSIYRMYYMLTYVLTAGIILMTKPLAFLLFSNEFYTAWKYVPLLLIASAIGSMESFFSTFYLVDGKTTKYFVSSVVGAVANVVFNLLLIPKFGATGATIATAVSYFIVYIQRALYAKKNMGIDIQLGKNLAAIGLLLVQSFIYVNDVIALNVYVILLIAATAAILVLFLKEMEETIQYFKRFYDRKVKRKED